METFITLISQTFGNDLGLFISGVFTGFTAGFFVRKHQFEKNLPEQDIRLSCAPKGIWGTINVRVKNNKPILVGCTFFKKGKCSKDNKRCLLFDKFI